MQLGITCLAPKLPLVFEGNISTFLKLQSIILKKQKKTVVSMKKSEYTIIGIHGVGLHLLKLNRKPTHHCQLLSCRFPEGFGPSGLSWITLLLEVFVAFRFAESENLENKKHKTSMKPKKRHEKGVALTQPGTLSR